MADVQPEIDSIADREIIKESDGRLEEHIGQTE